MTAPRARSAAPAEEALVARFREALDRLWPGGGKLGLAVSGGPDSMAMLFLAEAAIPGRFEVATVDHGLRAGSAAECAMVADLCAARGIPCEVLLVEVAPGNVQAQARAARYAELAKWADRRALSAVATAHHADDQAETLLMRLNRGSGVAGLAGVRREGPMPQSQVALIRPLLGFRRAELAGLVDASGLEPAMDPSNADERFDRVRIRRALAECDWLDPLALAESATHLADADQALFYYANRAWTKRVRVSDEAVHIRPAWPREIARRVLARAIAHFGGEARGKDLVGLLGKLEAGEGGNVAGVLANAEGGEWVLRREPARRS